MEINYDKPVKIDLSKLMEFVNPFDTTIWIKCETPITKEEVSEAIQAKHFISPEEYERSKSNTPEGGFGFWDISTREEHICRVAWLVENYQHDFPVDIDFGVPEYGQYFSFEDGHHRIASAIYRNEPYVMAMVSGSMSEIEKYIFQS